LQTLKAEREVARATNDALIRAGAAAESAKDAAERKVEVLRRLFESLHAHHRACPGGMADAPSELTWEYGLQLQEENKAFKQEVKQLKDERARLEHDVADKAKESETKEQIAAALQRRHDDVSRTLDGVRERLDQQTKDAADIRANLDTAYADLTHKAGTLQRLRKEKDDADAALFGVKLQLQDAHADCQQLLKRVDELEALKPAIEALEQEKATLQADYEDTLEKLNDHDRIVLVKDARNAYLEAQLQKALTSAARARDEQNKAEAAADPTTAEPTSIPPAGSLEEELDHLSEASDELFAPADETDPEAASQLAPSLELVAAITAAHTAPSVASTTTSSTQTAVPPTQTVTSSTQTDVATTADIPPTAPQQPVLDIALSSPIDTAPVDPPTTLSESDVRTLWQTKIEPALRDLATTSTRTIDLNFIVETVQDLTGSTRTTSSIQTEPEDEETEELSISLDTVAHIAPVESSATQTEPPKLTHTGTSTTLDQPPVVHEERHTQTETPTLTHTGTSTVLDQPPVMHEERYTQFDLQAPPKVVFVSKKSSFFSLSTAAAIFFALLAILYYVELESWKHSSNRAGVNRLYNSMGYQRRGRHLFGTIPVCYERGETWLTEAFCQRFAAGVQKAEAWIGIKYPDRW
jgi:hypothetical protein